MKEPCITDTIRYKSLYAVDIVYNDGQKDVEKTLYFSKYVADWEVLEAVERKSLIVDDFEILERYEEQIEY